MSKNSSAKYYQGNKKQLQKRVGEKYQGLSKEEKKKIVNTVVKGTQIYQR